MPNRAFVTGGTGLIGSHLVRRLVSDGSHVTALVRSDTGATAMRNLGANPVWGDVTVREGLREAMSGSSVVFNVAGINEGCPRDARRMDSVNIEGPAKVVNAAADAGVGRVVHTSSVAAIGEPRGMVGTERTSHSGDYVSAYARSKHLGERAARDTAAERGIDLVVVNPSSVQGPGRTSGSAELILRTLRSKRPWLVDVTASIVSLNDCVEGHRRAAVLGRTGERYILSGHSLSVAEAVETVNALVENRIEPRWVSEGLVRTLGQPLASIVALVRPGGSLCPDMIRSLLHGHRFDNAKSRDELGVVYEPLEVTFAQTIDWFRSEGLIET